MWIYKDDGDVGTGGEQLGTAVGYVVWKLRGLRLDRLYLGIWINNLIMGLSKCSNMEKMVSGKQYTGLDVNLSFIRFKDYVMTGYD